MSDLDRQGWFSDAIRGLFAKLDSFVYSLISGLYQIFYYVATATIIEGETVADVLEYVQFTPKRMARTVEVWATTSVKKGIISPEEGREFLSNYRSGLYGYTYLE